MKCRVSKRLGYKTSGTPLPTYATHTPDSGSVCIAYTEQLHVQCVCMQFSFPLVAVLCTS